jgi:hypothetical protein
MNKCQDTAVKTSERFRGLREVNIVENQGMGVQEPDESYITPLDLWDCQSIFFKAGDAAFW